jgi:hypothetical protein
LVADVILEHGAHGERNGDADGGVELGGESRQCRCSLAHVDRRCLGATGAKDLAAADVLVGPLGRHAMH